MALKIDFWQPDLYLVLRMFFMLISAQIFYSKALKHHTQLMIVHGSEYASSRKKKSHSTLCLFAIF